jgi:hypothetical protein
METTKSGPLYIFRVLSGSQIGIFRLEAEIQNPGESWFWWPNHEGERGRLEEVSARLDSIEDQTRGVSVNYPTSAFFRTIIIGDGKGGVILSAMPDEKGRITRINVKSRSRERVEFSVKTGRANWLLTQFHGGPEEAMEWLNKIIDKVKWPRLPVPEPEGRYMQQVGLIGPDYDCVVPEEKGFMILEDIAGVMKKHLGKGHWLHVFGYAHGHDILYPDYNPSVFLGGRERLKEAVKAVHRKGQKVSLYLNIRLADQCIVENDFELQKAVFKDTLGKQVRESAHERDFLVMNSESPIWHDRLGQEAERLVELGIDGIELNHRGIRSVLVPLGEQWGGGIRTIISRIRKLGVKVWFRGGSDIYPSDWLELCREELTLEEDGHIFSGYPIGEFDPRLFMTLVPGNAYLKPLSRPPFPRLPDTPVMTDLEDIMGGLFIYSEEYLERIDMILKRAASESEGESGEPEHKDEEPEEERGEVPGHEAAEPVPSIHDDNSGL